MDTKNAGSLMKNPQIHTAAVSSGSAHLEKVPGEVQEAGDQLVAGRSCPIDYHYDPRVFDRPAEFATDVLYVVGGLYGNCEALNAIELLAARDTVRPLIVCSGDFHWLDAERDWFSEIESRVSKHVNTRGNVESELARTGDVGVGCGCGYPPAVSDEVVDRSNRILGDLRMVALTLEGVSSRLRRLPMHLVGQIGDLRIGVVHGDATALAGWKFGHEALNDPTTWPSLGEIAEAAQIDVFASTHTGLPALRDLALTTRRLTVINNGAAGLPNFSGSQFGVISRIAASPSPHPSLYGIERDGVYVDALSIDYDSAAFVNRILRRWPEGSVANAQYLSRILAGPDYSIEQATPGGF